MIDIAVDEMKRNRGQRPENKKMRDTIDTIVTGDSFDIRFQNT